MATVGGNPVTRSTSGFSSCSTNCRAYGDMLSRNRRWPSANRMSNATVDLPEPLNPVITTSCSRGILRSMFLRLCSRAPWIWIARLRAAAIPTRRSCIRQLALTVGCHLGLSVGPLDSCKISGGPSPSSQLGMACTLSGRFRENSSQNLPVCEFVSRDLFGRAAATTSTARHLLPGRDR